MKELNISAGQPVLVNARPGIIHAVIGLDRVLVRDDATGDIAATSIESLEPVTTSASFNGRHLDDYSEDDLKLMDFREAALAPLLNNSSKTTKDVEAVATKLEVHRATAYRWIEYLEETGDKRVLISDKPTGGKNKSRLDPDLESILKSAIHEVYLTPQKHSIPRLLREVNDRCKAAGLKPPAPNTIRKRVGELRDEDRLAAREGLKVAADRYHARAGIYQDGKWPLSLTQIDHTPVNVMVVDREDRRPLGRPWLTVAIDVYSRMITGFFLSMDRPSELSVGMCVSMMVLPKEPWLLAHDVRGKWPIWNFPSKIHADNAKEFKGRMIKRACKVHNCDLEWRPIGEPHFGAHIEALCGTLSNYFNELAGTTFSNIKQRGSYKPHKMATMTLEELETWLTTLVVEIYNSGPHTGIGTTPLKKFEEGIFGDGKTPGTGLKPRPLEPEKLRMDLLPYVERSVQTYGFTHQNIHYYSDVLRTWIRARDPENSKKIRKFAFHYDPRSMKQHFFFDPTVRQYFPVPYRDTTRPDLSIWEIREAQKFLKKQGIEAVDEDAIFRAWERLRKIEAKAKSKTKKAKLDAHRRDRAASELVGTPGRDLASDALDHFPTGETGTPESIVAFEDLE